MYVVNAVTKMQTHFPSSEQGLNTAKIINTNFLIFYCCIKYYLFVLVCLLPLSPQNPKFLFKLLQSHYIKDNSLGFT